MTNAEDFAPLDPVHLVTQAQGWSIIYSPGGPEWHQHKGALERHGIEGSGYDFSGALRATLTDHEPSVLDAVGFDPEGGMVSVYGSDLGALHTAARHLHRLVTDEQALDAALARSVELGLDD
ncbi:Imm51 family immunity protein [Cellulosimicrobium sp. E-16]|uniref:Imm51 family immunity protein n=1 Tax=Cellulosimicrobium sp. E-16 TaxID=3404049 RepID=UPI003CE6DAC9